MNVSDEAVEAAFREMSKPEFRSFRDEIRAGLEAAAPYMLKPAYDLGFRHGSNEPPNPYKDEPPNPYGKAPHGDD